MITTNVLIKKVDYNPIKWGERLNKTRNKKIHNRLMALLAV